MNPSSETSKPDATTLAAGSQPCRRRQSTGITRWRFFFGACFLTGALLVPHAGPGPVIAGMALAALVRWGWSRIGRDRA